MRYEYRCPESMCGKTEVKHRPLANRNDTVWCHGLAHVEATIMERVFSPVPFVIR